MNCRELRAWLNENIDWTKFEQDFGELTNDQFNDIDDRVPDCNSCQDMIFFMPNSEQMFLLKIKEVKKKSNGFWK